MTDDPLELGNIGVRVGDMWLKLAELIEGGVADAYISVGPEKAMRYARCAEACFWQAGGECDSPLVKEILTEKEKDAV